MKAVVMTMAEQERARWAFINYRLTWGHARGVRALHTERLLVDQVKECGLISWSQECQKVWASSSTAQRRTGD